MTPAEVSAVTNREAAVLDGAFGCGYLVRTSTEPAPGILTGWARHRVGELTYHLHPRTQWAHTQEAGGPGRVVLIGTPIDVSAGTVDADAICTLTLRAWASGGVDAAVRYLAYLGGRWTAVLEATGEPGRAGEPGQAGEIVIVPDCQATQAVFYDTRGGFTFASQPSLVAAATGAGPDQASQQMRDDLRAARKTGVVFLPGIMTTHEQVLPLVPNHLLRVRHTGASATVAHERFWPFQDRVENTETAAVTDEFIDFFREHTALICSTNRPVLSLTGGKDSRTTFAAALPHLRDDSFVFTYYNPRDGLVTRGAPHDVIAANALAAAVGVPHRLLQWREPQEGSIFAELYDRTYPVRRGSTGAAHAMWADLPHDIVHLQSIGAELGTTFYTVRRDVPITPHRLMEIVSNRTDLGAEMEQAAFADYLDYAQFTTAAIGGYDYHDVFYWEQRMGKWGYLKYQDGDFAHRMLMPFNARGLIEIMQSLPYDQRESKVLLHAMLATVPALADFDGDDPAERPETPITWRDLVAARPRVRPRVRRVLDKVTGGSQGAEDNR